MMEILRCTVNNKPVEVGVDPRESLADTLRERLGLTSVKKGCEVGECGACTVLVDGEAIDSCIYLSVWAQGRTILTVEGLQDEDGGLSPIQKAFVEEAAVQCGFCTPGIIMSAVEIVGSGKQYTREELRKLISGHLCRCTGYQNILNAVERAVYRSEGPEIRGIEPDPFRNPFVSRAEESSDQYDLANYPHIHEEIDLIFLRKALSEAGGSQKRAAELLRITYDQFRGLYRKYHERLLS